MITQPTLDDVMVLTRTISSHTAFENEECQRYYDILNTVPERGYALEIGLQFGRSSSIALQLAAAKNFHYIGIDPFYDPPEACDSWMAMARITKASMYVYVDKSQNVEPRMLPMLDVALIDGDHEAAGVAFDCSLIIPKIKMGGYVLFHDYGRASLPDVYPTVKAAMVSPLTCGKIFLEMPTVGCLGVWRRVA